jgi:hypothetical protein
LWLLVVNFVLQTMHNIQPYETENWFGREQ